MFIVKEVGVCGGVCVWKGERGDQDVMCGVTTMGIANFFPRV